VIQGARRKVQAAGCKFDKAAQERFDHEFGISLRRR